MPKLSDYRRSALQVEVELPKGLKVCLKEFGTPNYWRVYMETLQVVKDGDLTESNEYQARARALAMQVVVWIQDEDTRIEDKEEIYKVLSDLHYWELVRDIINAASTSKKFFTEKDAEAKKLSESTPENTSSGENDLEEADILTFGGISNRVKSSAS